MDVGASYFLPRISNNPALGLYLALTGHKLKGKEAVAYGAATHFVEANKIEELRESIKGNAKIREFNSSIPIETQVEYACVRPMHMNLEIPYLDEINRLFKLEGTIQELFDRLRKSSSHIAEWSLSLLSDKNPLALALTFELLKRT